MLPMIKAKYLARAIGAAQFMPASSGNQQIAIPLEVTEGEFAGETISWIATFHETADKNGTTGSERIVQSLQHMGWQGDDMSELVEIDDATAMQLLPDVVQIVCEPDTYDGKTTLKVKWINKPGGGRFAFKDALDKNDVKSFAAQMKSTVRSVRASNGGPRKPASNGGGSRPHPNAPGNNAANNDVDDIPFATADMSAEPSPIARLFR